MYSVKQLYNGDKVEVNLSDLELLEGKVEALSREVKDIGLATVPEKLGRLAWAIYKAMGEDRELFDMHGELPGEGPLKVTPLNSYMLYARCQWYSNQPTITSDEKTELESLSAYFSDVFILQSASILEAKKGRIAPMQFQALNITLFSLIHEYTSKIDEHNSIINGLATRLRYINNPLEFLKRAWDFGRTFHSWD